jgi:hypothetical protein
MTVVQELNALDTGVERAAERLLSLQHPDGWWKGELESNATMIAEHLFLLHFLGLRDAETDRLLANELLAATRTTGHGRSGSTALRSLGHGRGVHRAEAGRRRRGDATRRTSGAPAASRRRGSSRARSSR